MHSRAVCVGLVILPLSVLLGCAGVAPHAPDTPVSAPAAPAPAAPTPAVPAPPVAELARRMRISRQAAHRTATGLERAGLLRYAKRGGDRRLRLASLTPDGERSLERLESTMRTLLLEMTNSISSYWLEPLTDALTRLSDRLRCCPSVLRASRLGRRAGGRPRKIRQPG